MASSNAVWGIDVGQCALKAIKVRAGADGANEVLAYDVIDHSKLLSQPDADADELIREAVGKFASRNEWQKDDVVLAVPGQQSFARFCKLPPLESKKKIPDLVKFEAGQQIPFDMQDVVWDYQVFSGDDSPETEVGIFAMRKDLVRKWIDAFGQHGISPTAIQSMPAALYNYAAMEFAPEEDDAAMVVIDVGAQNTDLIVVEKDSAWMRNIPLGGNNFTEALVKGFKLSFSKAENLKRTAASSKYARQIFQAMRPIFAELVAEIQRSLGFYSSTHRDIEIKNVVAVGNAFQLPGLLKYLENNLTVEGGVIKPEKFKTLTPAENIDASEFHEKALSLGPAYGLALQGLGQAKIDSSLLPIELARLAAWQRKTPFWIGAAACLGIAAVAPWTRGVLDQQALASDQTQSALREAQNLAREQRSLQSEFSEARLNPEEQDERIDKLLALKDDAAILPRVISLVHRALPETHPQLQRAAGDPEALKQLIKSNPQFVRGQRKQIFFDEILIDFDTDITTFEPGQRSRSRSSRGGAGAGGGFGPGAMGTNPYGGGGGYGGYGGFGGGGYGGDMGGGRRDRDDDEDGEGKEGLYVHVSGRLLYGENRADASAVLANEYFKRLQELGRRPGLGFYVMRDDPESDVEEFTKPVLRQVRQDEGVGNAAFTRVDGEMEAIDPRFLDPVTGESTLNDWNFSFGFRIVMGDPPAEEEEADDQQG